MASLPPRHHSQPQQRRSSGNQRESTAQSSASAPDEASQHIRRASSSTSVDSQTVLLDHPEIDQSQFLTLSEQQESASSPSPYHQKVDDDTRKCWICFEDETEDTPQTSRWISPCPCALTAHEACLLDWIADMERPSASRATPNQAQIRCPQCKSEIHLSRPRNQIVELVSVIERIKDKLLLPTVLGGLGYGALLVFSHHGAHSVRMIFGASDAETILAPRLRPSPLEQAALRTFPNIAGPLFRGWRGLRMEVGLPLIPLSLIASRTTLADAILPVLPILFFATSPGSSESLTSGYWPPSAALTLVTLPYLRGIYDEYLERVWAPHERRWVKEIQPRQGEGAEAAQEEEQARDGDRVVELELGFEVEVIEEEVEVEAEQDGEQFQDGDAPQRAPPLHAPPLDAEPAPRPRQAEAPPAHRHDANIVISATKIADTVVGALLFPTICRVMGEALRLGLPLSWTGVPVRGGRWGQIFGSTPTGLLQTRWGRSIVGGCLFVVLKDAVRIYCRWRMAQAFRKRHVLDYDKKAGRVGR